MNSAGCRRRRGTNPRVDLSPEHPGAAPFISKSGGQRVIASIGHTAATVRQVNEAVDAGATMSTHLGNGSHPLLPRHENYLWAMADDRLTAGMIADGHHLPRSSSRSIVRAEEPRRCVLVSDLSGYAGLPAGRYQTQLCELEFCRPGKLVVAGQEELLAGASRPLCEGISNVMDFAGVGLVAAVDMAARRPAELLGLEVAAPRAGSAADFMVFTLVEGRAEGGARLEMKQTVGGGEVLWQAAS